MEEKLISMKERGAGMDQQQNTTKLTTLKDQIWENLTISNNFIFTQVLKNPELCKGVLERLLDIHINHIEYPKDSKIMRLDVYLDDGKDTICYVVLQVATDGTSDQLSYKAGYLQKAIDLEAIAQGMYYNELPDSFVIFICTFDVFGQDLWEYTFQNKCKESDVSLDDGLTIIFFNTSGIKGTISKDTENILKFIQDNVVKDDFTKELAQEVQRIKKDEECKKEYMVSLDAEIGKV